MNLILRLRNSIVEETKKLFSVSEEVLGSLECKINGEKEKQFGDISSNVAMIIAKQVGRSPRDCAVELQNVFQPTVAREGAGGNGPQKYSNIISSVAIAGPGFLNFTLTPQAWQTVVNELITQKNNFFIDQTTKKLSYNIEFVSANPTGPLHLGHGRGGIIGDVLANVLTFLGHKVSKEFYINDAGNQVKLLGQSLKVRCLQELGQVVELPEGGYAGDYLVDLAKDCVAATGPSVAEKSDQFFELYAKENLLHLIKADLKNYGIVFDTWFSEKSLHDSGAVQAALNLLQKKELAYEHEGALWFKSTQFGDDKDRVVRKSSGELTYIAADIAYHKDKFDRGFDMLINVLGHDHHGYVRRLKATMEALGYRADHLHVILYQLVNIKNAGQVVKMSKRAGVFTKLSDVVEEVGPDVARFFYLNRKNDAALDFDVAVALKKTEENPVYYIQYAYVRIHSLLQKASAEGFADWIKALKAGMRDVAAESKLLEKMGSDDIMLIKKIVSLYDVLHAIETGFNTHMLSYYALELAQAFHAYYTRNKIIDAEQQELSKARLLMAHLVYQTLHTTLDLLGLGKPEKM